MRANRGELAKAMVEAGLNGGQLAKATGCSPTTITKLRRGADVYRSTAVAVSAVLGRPLEELFAESKGDRRAA